MRNILVIEDSPLVLKILEHLFRQEPDLQPVFCASLGEAEVMLETSAGLFFAAIADLHLPDAPNGESVDLVMRYHLPCIVLSGSYNEQRRDDLLAKGVVDYVLKESQHSYEYAFRLLHRLDSNSHIKILVADDSDTTRHYIRNILTPHRYQVLEARDGKETLRLLGEQPDIDLLVLDHAMPGVSGFELVKLLRQKLRRNDLIIIGVSADPKGSLSAQFIKHGADDFLRKPFCPEELNCRVMSTLERRDLLRALKQAAQFDALTGLNNRRAFYEQGLQLLQQAQREGREVSAAMLDLDHFKQINDGFGHASGDSALVVFARALSAALPQMLLGRLGGEEFALLSLDEADRVEAALDELRHQCAALHYAAGAPPLSFSAGLYRGEPDDLESLLHEADVRLYRAKQQGRARTVLSL
ncbi:diguanylate cyclase domain-containing protein [Ectopseudomonas hydrolytica]|uniref:diguanylate cyclase domain-containing protein n=1 Tax=Ectopseudomonas hydrolytica TaxID=2493633 RepID=UPI0020B84405|nr:diguanylate cyclase [Pseudomonas hydrolytica]UTH32175.1 diguanylate cyclase [Pseudomonas hydrolytica]UZZ11348.1 diguanylate cyclase [Pseudomonas mendocina]